MSIVATLPVVTRIGDELFNRLNRLTAGYSDYTYVYEVVRATRIAQYTPRHLQIILTKGDRERRPENDCFGNPQGLAYAQRFDIRCHVLPSELDDTPIDQYCEVFEADIVKTVCDATRWHTFGELAINAEWIEPEAIVSEGGIGGVNVPIAVVYRIDEGNPYNVRA